MLKYRKPNRNVEAVMKLMLIKLVSVSLLAAMLLTLVSCSALDKIVNQNDDGQSQQTTQNNDDENIPKSKYERSDLKYSFLTVVEGFKEGVPAQISYSVFDTSAATFKTLQIPTDTFVSGANKTLGEAFKSNYDTAASDGRKKAVEYACKALMEVFKADMLLECDYYIYFDKTSLSDLMNQIGQISVKIPFDMRFSDGTFIRQGNTSLDAENFWRVLCYDSYAQGSEMNAAKLLWSVALKDLRSCVSSDTISLFVMDIRANLFTNVPHTNGVDVFFVRKILALDIESISFSSADVRSIVDNGKYLSVVCKETFVEKINTYLSLYETSVDPLDFDTKLAFCDNSAAMIADAYNSSVAPTVIYTAHQVINSDMYIFEK